MKPSHQLRPSRKRKRGAHAKRPNVSKCTANVSPQAKCVLRTALAMVVLTITTIWTVFKMRRKV